MSVRLVPLRAPLAALRRAWQSSSCRQRVSLYLLQCRRQGAHVLRAAGHHQRALLCRRGICPTQCRRECCQCRADSSPVPHVPSLALPSKVVPCALLRPYSLVRSPLAPAVVCPRKKATRRCPPRPATHVRPRCDAARVCPPLSSGPHALRHRCRAHLSCLARVSLGRLAATASADAVSLSGDVRATPSSTPSRSSRARFGPANAGTLRWARRARGTRQSTRRNTDGQASTAPRESAGQKAGTHRPALSAKRAGTALGDHWRRQEDAAVAPRLVSKCGADRGAVSATAVREPGEHVCHGRTGVANGGAERACGVETERAATAVKREGEGVASTGRKWSDQRCGTQQQPRRRCSARNVSKRAGQAREQGKVPSKQARR
ncbi:hypothetical protein ERJ75_001203000 [Trypanosoma vivax]|nr:hypothetical protein ERJ75_001203000 [Trypanosoma vivax]